MVGGTSLGGDQAKDIASPTLSQEDRHCSQCGSGRHHIIDHQHRRQPLKPPTHGHKRRPRNPSGSIPSSLRRVAPPPHKPTNLETRAVRHSTSQQLSLVEAATSPACGGCRCPGNHVDRWHQGRHSVGEWCHCNGGTAVLQLSDELSWTPFMAPTRTYLDRFQRGHGRTLQTGCDVLDRSAMAHAGSL